MLAIFITENKKAHVTILLATHIPCQDFDRYRLARCAMSRFLNFVKGFKNRQCF